MTSPSLTARTQTSDREVIFSRLIDAPAELVWKSWSDVHHLHGWWGPSGFTTTTDEFEFVPGGAWRFIMHGPDGTDYPTRIIFREIVPPLRLVFDNSWDLPEAPLVFTGVATFVAEGKQTRLSLRMTFRDTTEFRSAVELYGVLEGGMQTFERLAEYVSAVA